MCFKYYTQLCKIISTSFTRLGVGGVGLIKCDVASEPFFRNIAILFNSFKRGTVNFYWVLEHGKQVAGQNLCNILLPKQRY